MLEIRPDRLAHYRDKLAHLDAPLERKDDVIRTLAWFWQSWIDDAFSVGPVQLAVQERLSDSFQTAAKHDNVPDGHDAERIDLDDRGREQSKPYNNGCAP